MKVKDLPPHLYRKLDDLIFEFTDCPLETTWADSSVDRMLNSFKVLNEHTRIRPRDYTPIIDCLKKIKKELGAK